MYGDDVMAIETADQRAARELEQYIDNVLRNETALGRLAHVEAHAIFQRLTADGFKLVKVV